jgi:uncharacterized protein YybS (DUF2232 family)
VKEKSAINPFTGVAVLTILTALLLIAASVLPPLGVVFYFFLKAPLILIYLNYGFRRGLLAFALIAGVVIPLSRFNFDPAYLIEFGAVALVMAYALNRKLSFGKTIVACAIVSTTIALISMALHPPMNAANIMEVPAKLASQLKGDIGRMAAQGGRDSRHLGSFGNIIFITAAVVRHAFPALLLSGAAMGALLNYLAARKLSRRFIGREELNPGSLSRWALGEGYVWLFIAGGLLAVIPWGAARTVGLNLVVGLLFAYFLQGIAIISFFFRKWNLSALFRVPIYIFIFFNIYLAILVAAMGLFDLWVDFRKLRAADDGA